MRMNQEMQNQGQWLFRWRSYLPLLFFVLFIPAFWRFTYPFGSHTVDCIWDITCLFIGLIGLVIRGLTIGYTSQNTSGRNTKNQIAESLNTKGMYSLVRNPLYLGNFFMWAAPILFFHAWWLCVIYVLAFIIYYERIIITEETFLTQKFGDEYVQWATKTPVFFPRHLHWVKPELAFSWRTVLRREYHGLFGLIATLTALEFVSDIYISRMITLDPVWAVIFVAGAVFYLTIRILAKCTLILRVEGRS